MLKFYQSILITEQDLRGFKFNSICVTTAVQVAILDLRFDIINLRGDWPFKPRAIRNRKNPASLQSLIATANPP